MMTAEEFRALAVALFGEAPGWQTRVADALGVHRSQVSRYLAGAPIPGPVKAAMLCWAGKSRPCG